MPTRTVLISGAANGLGAAFLEAYRKQPDTHIIAIDRAPIPSDHENVQKFTVDMTDESSITRLATTLASQTIDLLIHSAGIRGLVPHLETAHHGDVAACETLQAMDLATLTNTFAINAAGTFLLFRALLPNLRLAKEPKVIVMSSRMGSLSNNSPGNRDAGSAYAYRASKAALNALVRSFVVDVPEVMWVLCHPGRVETGLVKWREEGAIGAEESVKGLVERIERWGGRDSGGFYDRFGEVIPCQIMPHRVRAPAMTAYTEDAGLTNLTV
ncbi:hypothetical protein LTR91_004713 [Friedmanniomyces endolithicus]|uniref:NAD(P)-binding protein n=1 Tax=Friedmanniomyces endolithicus TaxID=329885 RepID=A0AAN6F677_9PEZI|nr:hypothetical protein LTS09_014401 [Friedmanniomyces endolithicus]KAK0264666.1 hypothetical protein LTR35_017266 [Friedmanniomyces endolithicus]KAK0269304.1 hypothetical protein LTS00_017327 [Friedmanniomyces endolithicus]KAK0304424.1 hypothetical protein LTR82_017218 [Friedmanniomyces endolithicus]KAK0920568.1 hypothetical protein LTR57_009618 [Friedmanniomyces endolithicus]